jgi:hypothetical protein
MLAQVLEKIAPDMLYTSSDGTWANVIFEEAGFFKPCDEYYEYTLYTLENADAIKKFREERNTLLDQSDKYMIPDYPNRSEKCIQDWKDYRLALRNLPITARPTLDEDGNLKGVVWPTVPTPPEF